MWVKIKSNKIPNVVLTVPYSAFLNSYQRKGFCLVDDVKAKNKSKNTIEQNDTKIVVTEQEKAMIDGLNNKVDTVSNENITENQINDDAKITEQEKDLEQFRTTLNIENEADKLIKEEQVKSTVSTRAPIKKAPNIKR